MTKRTKAILGTVATVVVLAAVIFGLSAISSPKKGQVTPPTIQYNAATQSQAAYDAGQSALQSGDTTGAIADFKKAIELDPNNTAAKQKLTEVTTSQSASNSSSGSSSSSSSSNSKSSSTGGSKTTTATAAADWTQKPVKALNTLLPHSFAGYAMGQQTVQGADGVIPSTPSDPSQPASHIEWSIHDRETPSGATKFVATATGKLYPKDSAQITVNGVPAYFGTDGATFATVVFRRGRFVFQVVLTSPNGTPSSLQPLAQQAANAFPTAPK